MLNIKQITKLTEKVVKKDLLHTFDIYNSESKIHSEFKTSLGNIDILIDNTIIEIKRFAEYKQAVGQLLSYKLALPKTKKYKLLLVLFTDEYSDKLKSKFNKINKLCKEHDIKVFLYNHGYYPKKFISFLLRYNLANFKYIDNVDESITVYNQLYFNKSETIQSPIVELINKDNILPIKQEDMKTVTKPNIKIKVNKNGSVNYG